MKRFLPVLLIVCLPAFLGAQQHDSFRLGMKGGPNFSFSTGEVESEVVTGPAFTVGGVAGGFGELVPLPWLSIELDILYSLSSYGVMVDNSKRFTILYNAIEFPLIAKGRFQVGGGDIFIGAGADMILVVGQVRFKQGDTNSVIQLSPSQVFHTALVVSTGYDMVLKSGNILTLELRYHHTFTTPIDGLDIHANRFDVIAGWSVNL